MKVKKIFQARAKIISNKKIKGAYYCCLLDAPAIASRCLPGQFVSVRVTDKEEPLLRRPFGIHSAAGRRIKLLYEVVGKGTEFFSQRKAGSTIDIIGPLGNGFDYRPAVIGCQPVLVVAGGMGVAPLLFLARQLSRSQRNTATAFIGARSSTGILCEKEFKEAGFNVTIATDDGSRGFKGYITALLANTLRAADNELRPYIYACGPRPMLAETARICRERRIPAQFSLEEHMACGIGACLGCVILTRQGYKRVCKEGPVFNAADLIWEGKGE